VHIIQGKYKGLQIVSPRSNLRPTKSNVKESLTNTLLNTYSDFILGQQTLELFAGSGQISFELLSLGAIGATLVEKEYSNIIAIKQTLKKNNFAPETTPGPEPGALVPSSGENSAILGITVIKANALTFKPRQNYSLLFADPPYNIDIAQFSNCINTASQAISNLIIIELSNKSTPIKINNWNLETTKTIGDTNLYYYLPSQ
jgi:16S rRNA (guanine(966)-N(2))-methyltransferase RsmD